ncbi:hypothetical protein NCC78_04810 [Micromonospora phytophila]|uniref:hypothetical protein n=1 Tax=Micromonospora phytophila TaxID=709888 RepID=UPI00202EB371|nr:hypothetical protein [Micromonospora phytophila]MCM0674024.1 hypothetical protein [Micromonospora phytophila]
MRTLNETSIPITDARSRWTRTKTRFFVACAVLGVTAILASDGAGADPPGDELKTGQGAYGWYASKDVGSKFTDGLNLITVTPQARGPLRLISARPLMDDGGTVRVIGILARINPDMLPPGSVGSFQEAPGFPPARPHAAGAVPVEGLIVQPPKQGENRWIELQIGYEVVAPGRSARRGVELVYEYEGAQHRAVVPSYLAVCAPSTAACEPEYDK